MSEEPSMDADSALSHYMRTAETVSTSRDRIARCHAAASGDFELSAQCRDSIVRSRALLVRVGRVRELDDCLNPDTRHV